MLLRKNVFSYWGLILFLLVIAACKGELTDGLDFIEESNVPTITTRIEVKELPVAIRSYVDTHFAETLISKSLRYQHDKSITYGVFLQSGVFLLFAPNGLLLALDKDGVESGDRDGQEILASELPNTIIQYIIDNYPNAIILFAEKEKDGQYEIYLDKEVELHFNEVGDFISKEQDDDDDGLIIPREDDDDGDNDNDDGIPNNMEDDDDDGDGTSDDDDDSGGTSDDDDDDDGNSSDDDDG